MTGVAPSVGTARRTSATSQGLPMRAASGDVGARSECGSCAQEYDSVPIGAIARACQCREFAMTACLSSCRRAARAHPARSQTAFTRSASLVNESA
ncbi:hypothetical protein C0Z20_15205 [Trinickia symbiotica]|uniref:Uncharacterized protein n=1 Tax=Trinickia symbiotica TaxID=863227 RepID=A0A2N7X3J9_9BURK|nr:hypothetical protein C0Z20_15205 [Trinickia symbiotica]